MAPVWNAFIVINLLFLVNAFPSLSHFSYTTKMDKASEVLLEPNKCPVKCQCSNWLNNLTISCEYRNLKIFPSDLPSSVFSLNLFGNEIFHLSYNSSLNSLYFLNVSHNSILDVDNQWLNSLTNLKILDLSNNSLQSSITENKFQSTILEYLDLSNNKLNFINNIMFKELYSLLSLNLSSNEIESMENNSFESLIQLSILNLNSNKLTDIQHEWFKNLQNLHTLILSSNKLNILRNVVFSTLKNLKVLDLSNNYIKSIGLLSFKGLTNLEFLNLSYNHIAVIQSGVFRSLQLLKSIDLGGNAFSKIDNIFIHTKSLEFVYLKNLRNFQNLTPFSFNGLHKVEIIDLSNSDLSDISLKTFLRVKNLKFLDLSSTKLQNLKMGVFNNLQKIEVLKLSGNPWKCDCYLYWLLIWLGEHTNAHLISPSETFCHSPSNLKGHVLLDALDLNMVCTNASIHRYTNKTKFKVGLPALLECQVEGNPLPSLTWVTPQNTAFYWSGYRNESIKTENETSSSNYSVPNDNKNNGRFYLMPNGNLAIRNVQRGDGGFYMCIASNPLSYVSISIRLTLDYEYIVHIKIVSVLVGMATSFGFLLLTLISVLIKMILKHFGIKCPCRSGSASPRTQQIKKILESMEHYKKQQLDRLRDNYNCQVQRIKDNCMQQMERLRESYSSQAERLRDIREYGTLQIDRIRDNYYSQVQRVRDYSASQIIRLRENYIFQRSRIRKFSAHHLYKLRENYKVQQQHFNKILENLNIESCRNVCQRTESVIFEPEILDNVLVPKICLQTFTKETCDSNDNSSQISAYFTPEEAGSEVSGHESEDQDSLNSVPNLENIGLNLALADESASSPEIPENSLGNDNDSNSNDTSVKCFSSETVV